MNPLEYEIKYLKGVGEYRARLLNKLNIFSIGDLLEHFPRDYINRRTAIRIRDLQLGQSAAIVGEIVSVEKRNLGKGKAQLNVVISDGDEYLFCTWFRFGDWFQKQFEPGLNIWASGVVTEFSGSLQMIHPETEVLEEEQQESDNFWHNRTILPLYSLTDKISMNLMRNLIYKAFELYHEYIAENLPAGIRKQMEFEDRVVCLQKIHFGSDLAEITRARKRFSFEELFFNQLMLARCHHHHVGTEKGYSCKLFKTFTTRLKNSLPFLLTDAQKRVIREIVEDMTSSRQMNRLLQGDVGSGKTIVTLFAMLLAVENNRQAVLMAPTEILAEQHYLSFSRLLINQPEIKIVLLKGGNYSGKKRSKEQIRSGEINIIIGTHALIQPDVAYHDVGFVAIDEQHRFGVEQRAFLARTNSHPDLMYLSATPIPRSLALTLYGDLDISVLDEIPPGRHPVKTIWWGSEKINLIYQEAAQQIKLGRQVYIVCPLIDESDKVDLQNAVSVFQKIEQRIFPQYRVSLLHGRLKNAEKDQIMKEFQENKIRILVSTTVIEVGIDVPNATVMIIEHAERFGLSQLHQLRGRVGRGSDHSACYLVAYPPISSEARERLTTMVSTNDGFKIAEKDLELRGPGEFFGTEQSGMPAFRHADLLRDQDLLKLARTMAFDIVTRDYELKDTDHDMLRKEYLLKYSDREKLFEF
ncbi:MAG: ATP-dependent DNA helicase RecG [Candidatus Cloacimonetes bacterium]|nr:ATP-dependent DNA helicase RecG [Candidatus Cloacimonadota bacterium]